MMNDDGEPIQGTAADSDTRLYADLSTAERRAHQELQYLLSHTVCRTWTRVGQPLEGLSISDGTTAADPDSLQRLAITHVLNCAPMHVCTGADFYAPMGISYHELEGFDDNEETDPLIFWPAARDFIHTSRQAGGRVSKMFDILARGPSLAKVLDHTHRKLALCEAIKLVKENREWLLTNETFQRALVRLASSLDLLQKKEVAPQLSPLSEAEEDEEEDEEGDKEADAVERSTITASGEKMDDLKSSL